MKEQQGRDGQSGCPGCQGPQTSYLLGPFWGHRPLLTFCAHFTGEEAESQKGKPVALRAYLGRGPQGPLTAKRCREDLDRRKRHALQSVVCGGLGQTMDRKDPGHSKVRESSMCPVSSPPQGPSPNVPCLSLLTLPSPPMRQRETRSLGYFQ